MNKMSIRVILKSGTEFKIKCDEFTLKRNGLEMVTGYSVDGITENKPIYLDFAQVAAIVRVLSDEDQENAEREVEPIDSESPRLHAKLVDYEEPDEDGNVQCYCSNCNHGTVHAVGEPARYCWFCGAKFDM